MSVSRLFECLIGAPIFVLLERRRTHLGAGGSIAPLFGLTLTGDLLDITFVRTERHRRLLRKMKKGHHLCRVMALKA